MSAVIPLKMYLEIYIQKVEHEVKNVLEKYSDLYEAVCSLKTNLENPLLKTYKKL